MAVDEPLALCVGVVAGVGLLAFPILYGARTRRWAVVLLGVFVWMAMVVLQIVIREREARVLVEAVGLLLGTACLVTRGHPELFVDDSTSEEASRTTFRLQLRVLAWWLPSFALLIFVNRTHLFAGA